MTSSAAKTSPIPSPPAKDWIELAESELRRAGYRSSEPRSAIVELIGRKECVSSARQLADELRSRGKPVGIATVYRTLEVLDRLSLVQRLDIGGDSARYEPALPDGTHHHHHLVCERCGKVTPFDDSSLERAIHRLSGRLDYKVGGHDVVLRGSCSKCAVRAR